MSSKQIIFPLFLCVGMCSLFWACSKKSSGGGVVTPGGGDTTVVIEPAIDPPLANTIGFFLDDWKPRSFTAPAYEDGTVPATASNTITVDASNIITKIPFTVFGHNAVWWMGPANTIPGAVTNITNLHPDIIRFPGGSSSDAYFWNAEQGVNPAGAPATLVDKDGNKKDPGYIYGKTTYNWQCSLDNYYTLLQQTGNQGIITINYAYARYGTSDNPVATAAHLAADWVRYDNGRTQYWEIGNENFGDWEWGYRIDQALNKDGQPLYITGALYAQHFQVFVDSMQQAAAQIGKKIYIGAVTLDAEATEPWQTTTAKTWNTGMMTGINNKADFYVVHNYFTPYDQNSNAATIFAAATTIPQQVINYVSQKLQTNGAAVKPVVMDEWNMWAKDSKQQVSNVSGAFGVLVLGEAIKNKYGLAARWDLMNGWSNGNDHGLFSPGDEPGVAKWSPRPSFYYLYLFQKLLGDRLVNATVSGNAGLKTYASTYTSGQANITIVNTTGAALSAEIKLKNFATGSRYYWYTLEGSNDNGEFSRKVLINGNSPYGDAGGPANYASLKAKSATTTGGIKITVPALGAVCMVVDKK
ncbi:alpha-L-arabinofuranosidase [Limnovirga soli]|uniref:Alpha-L-arabinofuranosidase n=1 Tax=Limnovirga soli TaxID=2656915 RepID=A0A8J8FHC6_9BACT|nr:alpha-L-arabinofuranosidase [Limnovirga soli]NNV57898.1 alpha-L-arabinofuranosidase [Limnovirga soli]